MAKRRFSKVRASALKHGYRSGLEESLSKELQQRGINGEYEKHKIAYTQPETQHTYTPDFRTQEIRSEKDQKQHMQIGVQKTAFNIVTVVCLKIGTSNRSFFNKFFVY
mgnify:CR=1 FL=1